MDGSAIYYVICVIYIAAMAGHPLTFVGQLKVGVVGALVTCGAAPIPGGFVSHNTIAWYGVASCQDASIVAARWCGCT